MKLDRFACGTIARLAVAAVPALVLVGAAQAGNLVYQPVNPSFGGSPLNGSWLQSEAGAQNEHEKKQQRLQQLLNAYQQQNKANGQLTPGQEFARILQSQLYGSLANQITEAIFGENAQKSGTFSFEGTIINFNRVGNNIKLLINDGQSVTEVIVPASTQN
jgi:curli production assembly/transport component CsgF